MGIKKNKPAFKPEQEKVIVEEKKHWQSFKVLKQFPTSEKIYEVGETFKHHDKKVINFLKINKII
jgi:hypothetical protein